ncbi:MAG: hypothetical protein NTZ24_10700 [Deltaproteobacteria bacterium]|nr:hypothetical protein [Deltaproteobacteria bacterium]
MSAARNPSIPTGEAELHHCPGEYKTVCRSVLIMARQPVPEDENLTQPDPAEEPKPSKNLA